MNSLVSGSVPTGSVAGGSVVSRGSRRNSRYTNSQGLELPLQAQLLEDIEREGGLLAVTSGSLTAFCNKQYQAGQVFYGKSRSRDRFRIENKVKHWKSLSSTEYYRFVKDTGITPYQDRPSSSPTRTNPPEAPVPNPVQSSTPNPVPPPTPNLVPPPTPNPVQSYTPNPVQSYTPNSVQQAYVPNQVPSHVNITAVPDLPYASTPTVQDYAFASVFSPFSPIGSPAFGSYREAKQDSEESSSEEEQVLIKMSERVKIVNGIITGR